MLGIDGLYELAKNRRSIRGYEKDRDVPDEYIRKILEIARWAPSGGNGPRPRRELGEVVHYEKYDRNKFRDDEEMEKFIMTLTRRGSYGKKTWVEDDQGTEKK